MIQVVDILKCYLNSMLRKNKYIMLAGEMLYSFKEYKRAINLYKKVITSLDKNKDDLILKKPLKVISLP